MGDAGLSRSFDSRCGKRRCIVTGGSPDTTFRGVCRCRVAGVFSISTISSHITPLGAPCHPPAATLPAIRHSFFFLTTEPSKSRCTRGMLITDHLMDKMFLLPFFTHALLPLLRSLSFLALIPRNTGLRSCARNFGSAAIASALATGSSTRSRVNPARMTALIQAENVRWYFETVTLLRGIRLVQMDAGYFPHFPIFFISLIFRILFFLIEVY